MEIIHIRILNINFVINNKKKKIFTSEFKSGHFVPTKIWI